jgi:preprotein translocase subunit Sec61beta
MYSFHVAYENNKCVDNIYESMADKKDGFQSGAGLIRYFDEEEIEGPALDPKLVIYIGVAMAVIVELATYFWPLH